jgi:small subunit ribosomal protein S1
MMSENDDPSMLDDDFSKLFEESLKSVKPGEVVTGEVVQVLNGFVTVDIGYKSEGQVPIAEFKDREGNAEVEVGSQIEVFFEGSDGETGIVKLSRIKAEQAKVWGEVEIAYNEGRPVEGLIVGKVKGGLKVDIGVGAFLPGSHADLRPTRNLDRFIGQRGRFAILKFNRQRGNVVVSRRSVLETERASLKEETLRVLEEGIILEGTVKNITDYGAFVDLGGIDGLLHITDMSWGRISHPSEVIEAGDQVKVVVLKYDPERERVSLGMKQIQPDPWAEASGRYPIGGRATGKVVSLTDYGAFIELEKGVEGLIHVSEMSWTKRVTHPSKLLELQAEVEVQVLDVDPENRRISLGLKQVEPNPWETVRLNHPIGSQIKGVVKSITDFGVFVGVEDGIDGLVHISDLQWTKKIRHPSELFNKGDEIDAIVLGVDVENERVSLGVKQLSNDPWEGLESRFPNGSKITGPVTSVTDFGVFVQIEEGIEGLVHVSQIANERIDRPAEHFQVGEVIECEILNIDLRERKIGLSVRALRRTEERAEMAAYMDREGEGGRFTLGDSLGEQLQSVTPRKSDGESESEG